MTAELRCLLCGHQPTRSTNIEGKIYYWCFGSVQVAHRPRFSQAEDSEEGAQESWTKVNTDTE